MRLRHFLAATAVSSLIVGGAAVPAHSATTLPAEKVGTLSTWGNTGHFWAAAAIPIPEDLTGPVKSVAVGFRATGVVTLDGHVRVWGAAFAPEWMSVPAGITDAEALSLSLGSGAALHTDGHITAWGGETEEFSAPPSELRAKAIAVISDTGYAVRPDGTVATWGIANPIFPVPNGLADVTDVEASTTSVLALRSDGTVASWGSTGALEVPDFEGKKAVQISNGPGASGVIFEDGTIKTWGTVPDGEPTFDGLTPATKVISLAIGNNSAAVTADGVVHAWGAETAVTTIPDELTGEPVNTVVVGMAHAAAITTIFRDLTKPTIAGTPTVGQILTATPATFSLAPDAPATGQWYAGEDPIAGETGTTLTLGVAQLGQAISYRTSATRGDEDLVSSSDATAAVAKITSTTSVSVAPGTSPVGTVRTLTATVTAPDASPTGTVTFTVDGTAGDATALTAGTATLALPADLAAGDHTVTAAYSGDASVAGSTSVNLVVTVAKVVSTTSLTVSPGTSPVRTGRTVTATVTALGGTSTGSVTFKVGTTTSPARPVSDGKATWVLPVGLAAGTHAVTATYSGDATTAGSTSPVLNVGISKAAASAALKARATGKTRKLAKKVTLTVKVRTTAGISPAGKVTITLKGKTKKRVVAKVNANGVATVVVKKIKRGKYTATVQYAGNTNVKAVTIRPKFKI
ncbi:hypothetical protein EFK50_11635 [Nocardioides marmoriginsengisoli]|uniref:Bacterial Ig-like domain-containing protein n=2 Tax=Nocardioides marmoriginsengisoli TaxID=661483 RepID=A0A3N0CGH7_9ACTN|nr:hypothetical protein EFK50_11635 [Nocardioides marmoriginsengisoli]